MEKIFYLDSNVFIFAYSDDKELGKDCRKILDMIFNGKIRVFTSTLTFDEVYYKIKKLKDKETALIVINSFLNLKNLNFISVDFNILNYSYTLLKKYNINPRDSIHLSCALLNDVHNIITNDKDFDKIIEIKRFDIKDAHKIGV